MGDFKVGAAYLTNDNQVSLRQNQTADEFLSKTCKALEAEVKISFGKGDAKTQAALLKAVAEGKTILLTPDEGWNSNGILWAERFVKENLKTNAISGQGKTSANMQAIHPSGEHVIQEFTASDPADNIVDDPFAIGSKLEKRPEIEIEIEMKVYGNDGVLESHEILVETKGQAFAERGSAFDYKELQQTFIYDTNNDGVVDKVKRENYLDWNNKIYETGGEVRYDSLTKMPRYIESYEEVKHTNIVQVADNMYMNQPKTQYYRVTTENDTNRDGLIDEKRIREYNSEVIKDGQLVQVEEFLRTGLKDTDNDGTFDVKYIEENFDIDGDGDQDNVVLDYAVNPDGTIK